mgnify:CR=1 FL=1
MNNIPVVGANELSGFLWNIANLIMNVGIVVAVIFIAINGYRFYTSSNNPQKRTEAMTGLFWSILGGIIVVGAKFFAGIILGLKPM